MPNLKFSPRLLCVPDCVQPAENSAADNTQRHNRAVRTFLWLSFIKTPYQTAV